ncbi:MAG: invasin domain 3-containing protein [Gammaproteobacteria bacterium]
MKNFFKQLIRSKSTSKNGVDGWPEKYSAKHLIAGLLVSLLAGCGGGDGFVLGANSTTSGTTTSVSTAIGSIEVISGAASIAADGTTTALIRAIVLDSANNDPISGVTVTFKTNLGTIGATAKTDTNGFAEVQLTSSTVSGTALVTADASGFSASVQVVFDPGPVDVANSLVTATPNSISADGFTNTQVTVVLVDSNGNLVKDGTPVTLLTSLGTIPAAIVLPDSSTEVNNPRTTTSGRAVFTLTSSTTSGTASLSLAEFPGVTGSAIFGSTGTGKPANIQATVANSNIFVAGVGKTENTNITINVLDDAGDPIADPSPAADNVRITFISHPNGGEFLTGTSIGGTQTTSPGDDNIDVFTTGGSVTINFQSGTLPGIIEVLIEILDAGGASLVPPLTATIPQMVIASGPPHTIVVTRPSLQAISDLNATLELNQKEDPVFGNKPGFYSMRGGLTVTDRYGNPVPNGTAISIGLVDTVITSDNDGSITNSSTTFTDDGTGGGGPSAFTSVSVQRNGTNRFIEANDRVLLLDGNAEDKNRFVASAPSLAGSFAVQSAFKNTVTGRQYVVGASLLGASVAGVASSVTNGVPTEQYTSTSGFATTETGVARFRMTYPANINTLNYGCNNVPGIDTRYTPLNSGKVYIIASSSDNSATTISSDLFCFSPYYGAGLAGADVDVNVLPTDIAVSTSGAFGVTLSVRDSGNNIPIPFESLTAFAVVTSKGAGVCSDPSATSESACLALPAVWTANDFGVTATNCTTDAGATCTSTVTVTGATIQPGDEAKVTYFDPLGDTTTSKAELTVKVQ